MCIAERENGSTPTLILILYSPSNFPYPLKKEENSLLEERLSSELTNAILLMRSGPGIFGCQSNDFESPFATQKILFMLVVFPF